MTPTTAWRVLRLDDFPPALQGPVGAYADGWYWLGYQDAEADLAAMDYGPITPVDTTPLQPHEAAFLDDLWQSLERGDTPSEPPPIGTSPVVFSGALERWTEEMRAGVSGQHIDRPSTWRFDDSWRAACLDALARDAAREGMRNGAQRKTDESRRLMPSKDERDVHVVQPGGGRALPAPRGKRRDPFGGIRRSSAPPLGAMRARL